MLNYLEFINEAVAKLKVPYYYSSRFKELLEKIAQSDKNVHASGIATTLLDIEGTKEYSDEITFIDITDKNDMVSFIQANRVKRIYDKGYADMSWDQFLLDITDDEDDDMWSKQRTELSIGRFVTRVFTNITMSIKDSEREQFVNMFKSTFDLSNSGEARFELVKGDIIKHWYLVDNYEEEEGQLGNSCMRYDECQNYFNIYTQNPEQVSLLILKSSNDPSKIVARAIVWKLTTGEFFMDRVYTQHDSDFNLFVNYSKGKGWRDKDDTSYEDILKFEVKLVKWKFDEYPYMDTFCCLNSETGVLSADEDKWPAPGWYKMRCTDGTYEEDTVVWSNYHDEYIQKDDAVFCEGAQDWVWGDSAIYLDYKEVYASPDEDVTYCSYNGEAYYSDDTVRSEYMDDNIYSEDAIEITMDDDGDKDYIHKDYSESITKIHINGKEVSTLDDMIILNPLDNKYYFKTSKIKGKNAIKYIVENTEKVDHEQLIKYIIKSDFDISEAELNLLRNKNFLIRAFDKRELIKIIKCMMIISPDKKLRDKSNVPNIRNNKDFNKRLLVHSDIIDKILGVRLKSKFFENNWHVGYPYLGVILSDIFANYILKDPNMFATWYDWKMNY